MDGKETQLRRHNLMVSSGLHGVMSRINRKKKKKKNQIDMVVMKTVYPEDLPVS